MKKILGLARVIKAKVPGMTLMNKILGETREKTRMPGMTLMNKFLGLARVMKTKVPGMTLMKKNSGSDQGFPKKDPLPTHLVSWEVEEWAENVFREF